MHPHSGLETLCFPNKVDAPVEVYRDPYTVISRQVVHFDHFTKEYFCCRRGLRAAMIPVRDGHILLTRQYRFIANRISTEIPGGAVEEGEQPIQAAVRECLEETGIRCLNPEPLIDFRPDLDTYDNPTFIFFSTQLDFEHMNDDERFLWMPFDEAERRVDEGDINDALSVVGILALGKKLRLLASNPQSED